MMSRYKWMLSLFVLVTLTLGACQPVMPVEMMPAEEAEVEADTVAVPYRILFLGTGDTIHNQGVARHLQGMGASATPPLQINAESAILSGATLARIWQSKWLREQIPQGDWDAVVLEGEFAMGGAEAEKSYLEHVRKFDELIRSVGARPVLFMDWPVNFPGELAESYPQIEEIARVVSRAGAESNVEVAPVGLAFERALTERPDLELYDLDMVHPNVHGTYLTTAVFYATLFDRTPVGHKYRPAHVFPDPNSVEPARKKTIENVRDQYHISEEDAEFLQRIAWDTVQEYQAEHGVTQ
jgi:hypothetical protein